MDLAFRRFLRFKFKGKFYQFRAMPFGLVSAPRTFTKLMRPITCFCCHLGICIIFYLDDTIVMARSREVVLQHRDLVLALFERLGLQVNLSKSDLAPAQRFTFLGLCWDTSAASVTLPEEKVLQRQASVTRLLDKGEGSCLSLQKFLGCTNFGVCRTQGPPTVTCPISVSCLTLQRYC